MTITQAQIEAAANAMAEQEAGWVNAENFIGLAEAALIAAAKVSEYQKLGIDLTHPNLDGSDFHLMNAVDDMTEPTQAQIDMAAKFTENVRTIVVTDDKEARRIIRWLLVRGWWFYCKPFDYGTELTFYDGLTDDDLAKFKYRLKEIKK